jgi:hypothetical protein
MIWTVAAARLLHRNEKFREELLQRIYGRLIVEVCRPTLDNQPPSLNHLFRDTGIPVTFRPVTHLCLSFVCHGMSSI